MSDMSPHAFKNHQAVAAANSLSAFFSCSRESFKSSFDLEDYIELSLMSQFLSHQFFLIMLAQVLLCQHYALMLLAPIMLKIMPA